MSRSNSIFVFFLAVISAISFGSKPASAQVTAGLASISGEVNDQSGANVPDAMVVVANESKGVRLTLTTSGGGLFNAPSLVPASGYTVTVDKSGFAEYQVKDITLLVGQNLNLTVPLTVASANQSVEVVGTAPLVDETKTDVSQVIDSQQILNLPINGRRVDTFVLLTPGVTNDGNFGLLTFRGVANGNTFLLDGNDSTDQFFGENAGRTRIASQISADAVQEFQVVSADYSAEFGRAMGGVVNTVTRSGTNQYHGTGYFFFRNQNFDATDPFALGINPDDWKLQSGASVGGPIVHDKLFFFVNADFTRRNSPIVDSIQNTNVNSATQMFVPKDGAHPNGCDPTVATPAQCTAISALLPRFFGKIPRTVDQDLLFGRLDYHYSDRNTFSGSFNYLHFNSPNGLQQTLVASTTGTALNNNGNDLVRVRNAKFTWMSILSPSFVNNFRYGWDTDLQSDELNPALNGSLGLLDVSAATVTLGAANFLPRVEPSEGRNEFGDDLSWTRGRHIFKFGVDFATTKDYSLFIQNAHGSYSYTTATSFAQDFSGNNAGAKHWTTYSQTFGNPVTNTRINDYDFYAEDQWRATNKLTANIGLRYEYSQIPQPPLCNAAVPLTCHINSPATNFMPRLGLAYQLDRKTVVRAGYGLFYARTMGASLQDLFSGNGVVTSSISLSGTVPAQLAAGPVFPSILAGPPVGVAQSTLNIQFASPNFSAPYSEQASLAVEREITPSLAVTVSYIWSRGIHLYSAFDTNLPPAANTANATYNIVSAALPHTLVGTYTTPVLLGVGGAVGKRPNSNFGAMIEDGNGVVSFYDGLAIQVNKRFSHGFQGTLSYTWSHELDDGQGFGQATQNIFLSSASAWLQNNNFRLDYGNGLENQPQRLAIAWIWAPTITHREGALYKYLVNNWQLSSITTINSRRNFGSPSITDGVSIVAGQFSTSSVNGTGLSSRVPFLPVSSNYQPALYRDDVRLSKILPFSDQYQLSLNFEAFNVTNSWSPTSMNNGAFTVSNTAGTCGSVALTPCLIPVSTFGTGLGDALPPDGTEARRLQVSARFVF